jgi:cytochrome c peroxidase
LCRAGRQIDLTATARSEVTQAYNKVARSIAAFEASPAVNTYTSKYDAYLAGETTLTTFEQLGMRLFEVQAKCAACHPLDTGSRGEPPLFTDFTFDNLGVPRNPDNPWYGQDAFNSLGRDWVDPGLGGFLARRVDYATFADENIGKQKVPTLRNVDKRPRPSFVKAYMHNGYFKSLKGVVNFYNTRDVKPRCRNIFVREAIALQRGCWPEPEVTDNVNMEELGNLGLSDREEDAIVAFLRTLSDGYKSD